MNLQEILPKSETLPRAIPCTHEQYSKLWSYRENGAWSHSHLIERIGNQWSDFLKGEGVVELTEMYLDPKKLMIIDPDNKVLRRATSDAELIGTPLENLASGGAIGQFRVKGFHPDYSPSIALNITEKGEQLGIGTQVHICSNFTIFGAGDLMTTWEKVTGAGGARFNRTLENILKEIKIKLEDTHRRFEMDLQKIEELKSFEIRRPAFERFLGQEFQRIERANFYRINRRITELYADEKKIILNSAQLSRFAVEAAKPSYEIYHWQEDSTNKWKVLNWATEVLKTRHGSDIMSVLKANEMFTQHLLKHDFNLN